MKNSQPKNQVACIKTEVPGELSKKLREEEDLFIADGLQGFALFSGIVVERARGSVVTDVDGNDFLDIIGGIGVGGIGHSHPKFIEDMKNQLEMISIGSFTSRSRINFLKLFDQIKLAQLNKVQFYSSGAEAVESALRLAKNYTGKFELVSFSGGFHGKTHGVLALMGSDFKKTYAPYSPGVHNISYANCYRCPFKLNYPSCGLHCVDVGRKQLKDNVTSGVAAFVIEPIQGSSGNIIPPMDFLPAVKTVAKEFDALFISDEMITGFGRTGVFWGAQLSGIVPDIMTIGKQFGGGFPVSGVVTSENFVHAKPWGNPSGSSSSFGGNPLASCAVQSTLSIIREEFLVENCNSMGILFLEKLKPFVDRYSFIGEVRGVGLMLAIELVRNKKTKIPLSPKACEWLFKEFLNKGLLTMSYTASFRIQPAMTIDSDTIENIISIMYEVFDSMEQKKIWEIL